MNPQVDERVRITEGAGIDPKQEKSPGHLEDPLYRAATFITLLLADNYAPTHTYTHTHTYLDTIFLLQFDTRKSTVTVRLVPFVSSTSRR